MMGVLRMSVADTSLQPESCACTEPDATSVAVARQRMIADATARDLAELFKALGDPTRVRILSALAGAEVCVGDLADALDMSQSARTSSDTFGRLAWWRPVATANTFSTGWMTITCAGCLPRGWSMSPIADVLNCLATKQGLHG
jgi:hypothetical protein